MVALTADVDYIALNLLISPKSYPFAHRMTALAHHSLSLIAVTVKLIAKRDADARTFFL